MPGVRDRLSELINKKNKELTDTGEPVDGVILREFSIQLADDENEGNTEKGFDEESLSNVINDAEDLETERLEESWLRRCSINHLIREIDEHKNDLCSKVEEYESLYQQTSTQETENRKRELRKNIKNQIEQFYINVRKIQMMIKQIRLDLTLEKRLANVQMYETILKHNTDKINGFISEVVLLKNRLNLLLENKKRKNEEYEQKLKETMEKKDELNGYFEEVINSALENDKNMQEQIARESEMDESRRLKRQDAKQGLKFILNQKTDLERLESDINSLNQIFVELSSMIETRQAPSLDNILDNYSIAVEEAKDSVVHLDKAEASRKLRNKRLFYLFLVLSVIGVLIAGGVCAAIFAGK